MIVAGVCEGVCSIPSALCPTGDLLLFADDRIILPSVVSRNLKLLCVCKGRNYGNMCNDSR